MTTIMKKTVLITGCSDGGIGGSLALAFHAQEFHVFATARTPSKMSELSRLPNITLLTLDVLDSNQITAAVEAVTTATGGSLDILINNSGVNHFCPTLDIDIEEAKRIFDTNFWAPLNIVKTFIPLVIKAKGSIVNVTSIAGHVNVPYMGKNFHIYPHTSTVLI
jgi:NAD(P)-dependent dehydrogenase (short-subunit alcohol dehydrogenase family)